VEVYRLSTWPQPHHAVTSLIVMQSSDPTELGEPFLQVSAPEDASENCSVVQSGERRQTFGTNMSRPLSESKSEAERKRQAADCGRRVPGVSRTVHILQPTRA
jgi:hypothetical protein